MKVGIVGTGHVGSTAAYTIAMQGICSEIVLVDHNRELADAHRLDILHAVPFTHSTHIHSAGFEGLSDCEIVILAAGVNQLPGETRMQLLSRNAAVLREILPQVTRHAGQPILLVATNPLDVMTQLTAQLSGVPNNRVLGTGTMLDTARFRAALAEVFKVSPNSVHAYVLGEHGDSEVLAWSSAEVGGVPIARFAAMCNVPITEQLKQQIDAEVRKAAYRIISGKGATYYGIGAALARLVRCIANDERMVFSTCAVSADVEGVKDVALSLPRVICSSGACLEIYPMLNAEEREALKNSALIIQRAIALQCGSVS